MLMERGGHLEEQHLEDRGLANVPERGVRQRQEGGGCPGEMMIRFQWTKLQIFQMAEHSLAQCHSYKRHSNEKKNMLSEVCKVLSRDY